MNVFMEGTNVITLSTLTDFFIHNREYTHGGNKWFPHFSINVFFNSYRWMYSWREQLYSRFQRWRIFLFITVNILIDGTNGFTFLKLMCFLNLTGGGNKCIHVFNVDDFVLFITVNILMEGTNTFTFLTLMCFLILTCECIHGGNKCIHVFNAEEFFYS